jgi:hypothetical protein
MTHLSPLTSRSFLPTALPAQAEKNARSTGADEASLVGKARNDLVSLSKNGVDLQQRVEFHGRPGAKPAGRFRPAIVWRRGQGCDDFV